jgi:hypothetical protein
VQITERDRIVLAFAAEHRLVGAAHVGVLLGVKTETAAARLNALATTGMLESDHRLHGEPTWYRIRPPGLRMVASSLPPPRRADLDSHRHDVGVAWLWLAARRGAFGALDQIVSERRMRSHDGTAAGRERPFGVRLGGLGPHGHDRLHYPDLLLETSTGHRVALELELTSKGRTRREEILGAYAADARVEAVMYLVDKPAVGRAISRSAARLGISDRVHVQGVSFEDPLKADGPQRAPERTRRLEGERRRDRPVGRDGGDGRDGRDGRDGPEWER